MNDTKYNGWTNYETWRVHLEMIDGYYGIDTADISDAYELGLILESYCEDCLESQGSGLVLDYALAFLHDVNWHEIGKALLESYEPVVRSSNLKGISP